MTQNKSKGIGTSALVLALTALMVGGATAGLAGFGFFSATDSSAQNVQAGAQVQVAQNGGAQVSGNCPYPVEEFSGYNPLTGEPCGIEMSSTSTASASNTTAAAATPIQLHYFGGAEVPAQSVSCSNPPVYTPDQDQEAGLGILANCGIDVNATTTVAWES